MGEEMIRLSSQNLDKHVKSAFTFARKNCKYDDGLANSISYPPMEDGKADGARLILRALYTMGYLGEENISRENFVDVCEEIGLSVSYNPYDIYKKHGIVCLQDAESFEETGASREKITYIYYSLGGRDMNSISKYDLGSPARVSVHCQPYKSARADEWNGKLQFVCFLYADKEKKRNRFVGKYIFKAKARTSVYMRDGAGRNYAILHQVPKGGTFTVYGLVTTSCGNSWYYSEHDNYWGWIYCVGTRHKRHGLPEQRFKAWTPDNDLACYMGAGEEFERVVGHPSAKNGESFKIINVVTGTDGEKWANVKDKNKRCYFVKAIYLKELGLKNKSDILVT